MKALSLLFLLAVFCLACGRDDTMSKASGRTRGGADLTVAAGCGGGAAALALDGPELRHIPAESLRVVQGDTVRALCDLLKDAKKPLAIVQFSSVTCFPCMTWVNALNASLAAKGYASSVLSIVAVTDPIGMLTADDERRIKRDVAPDAAWVYDDFQDLWKFFSPGPAGGPVPAVSPLAVAFDAAERGFASADASGDAALLVGKANELMGLGIAP